MSLSGTAKDTLRILDEGGYTAPSGRRVSLAEAAAAAEAGTELYRPGEPGEPWEILPSTTTPRIEVTAETTACAAARLYLEGGSRDVALLNFASAKNPGGGFLGGAKAQEEDLARRSGLYPCLLTQPTYYATNRAEPSMIYTDHAIWSPDVPFFKDRRLDLMDEPHLASVITSPAPNAGEALRRDSRARPSIRKALIRRSAQVLRIPALHGRRTLVLGAWGCGVFRNDPDEVAEVFGVHLESPEFVGAFDRVVFAIYDKTPDTRVLRAFQRRFG